RKPRQIDKGNWWMEHPGDIDDLWHAEKARDELIRISFGYWDWVKNVWDEKEKAANFDLAFVPIVDARRESRRLIGDYVLTQDDELSGTVFPDRISYGGWTIDVHHPKGIYSGQEGPFMCNVMVPMYTIPYRSIYSRNVQNLFMAGRHMSVTHVALGTVRVQATLATVGQAAGTAAALCLKHGVTPRGIHEKHLEELQQTLIKHDQYIPGFKNEDPKDLARNAKATASSVERYDVFEKSDVRRSFVMPMTMGRAAHFPTEGIDRLTSVSILVESEKDEPVDLTLHLRKAKGEADFSSAEDVAMAKGTVPGSGQHWVEFQFDCEVSSPFAWVWLAKMEGISWLRSDSAPYGACEGTQHADGSWHRLGHEISMAFFTEPPVRREADFGAGNVTNGITRRQAASPNMWASDRGQEMPQWVQLDFAEPVEMNTVYLTFDTDMNAPRFGFGEKPARVPYCIRDYDLAVERDGEWVKVAEVKGNFLRRRVHRFEGVMTGRLRVTVRATNGDRSARVFEVRAYRE
ncbi:FAD-dependent oxidoreductase, partial [bacterium]|nr:FAD-dependent oxidoreductase [bacterium]